MKNKLFNNFHQIINRLFTASFCIYKKNWDDVNEGFEFNPNDSRVLIRLLYSMQHERSQEYEAHVRIEMFSIIPYDATVINKIIISGRVILRTDGQIDYDFYEKILNNLSNF